MGGAAEHEMVVKQNLEVVAEVREFVRLVIGQWGMEEFQPCLVASELVTNALRHASEKDGDVTLRIGRTEDRALWLEVQDTTPTPPHLRQVDVTSEIGRGLMLVDYFCRSWGMRPLADNNGKVVFAILDPS